MMISAKPSGIKSRLYLLSVLLSAMLVIILYIACGIYPFGAHSVLTGDMGRQFVAFYSYFRSIFSSNNDFLYTFMKNLGGDMPGFCAYYLNNPLLLILFLFPDEKIAIGIEVLLLLQVSLCGLSASVLLNNINRPSYHSLIFSTAYAGMGFIFSYFVLAIYFSNLALLPLVILYYLKLLDKSYSRLPFILLTSLYLFMSYYLGYMLMIFFVIIYISRLIKDSVYLKRLPAVIFSIFTALCIDGVFLFMTAFSLRGEKSSSNADLSFYRKFKLSDFLSCFYAGNDKISVLPMVYCSLIALFFFLLYFCGRRPMRDKISSLFIVLSLALSMMVNTLDAVWHGFNNPVGFQFRYSYLLSGAVIVIGYRGYLDYFEVPEPTDSGKKLRILLPAGVMAIVPILLFLIGNPYMSLKRLSANLVILFIILFIILFSSGFGKNRKHSRIAAMLCLIAIVFELSYSSIASYLAYNADGSYENLPLLSGFYDEYQSIKEPVDYIKTHDRGVYRIEKDFFRSPNDPMLFEYIGLSHYSSCEKDEVKHFMERMGFRDTGIYAFYGQGSTAFADCLLGVKYFISRFDESYKPYFSLEKTGDYYIYENPFSLPFAFSSDRKMRKLDIEENDIFETQNDIASILSGKKEAIYLPALYDKEVTDDEIRYTIHISDRLPLYYYFDTENSDSVQISVNGEDRGPYFTDTNWNVYNAGLYDPGTELSIVASRLGEGFSIAEECFYYEDAEAITGWYESVYETLKPAKMEIKKSSTLSFDIEAPDHSYIILSIPYDKGWQIKLDGEAIKSEKVLDALLAIPVGKSAGTGNGHHIEMKYIPEGFFPGILFSVIGISVLIIDTLFYRKQTLFKL